MKKHYACKIIMVLTAVAIIGLGSNVFAQRPMGSGGPYGKYGDTGYHHKGHGCWANLSDEQIKQLNAQKKAFWDATAELRQEIYQKRLELQSELAKKDPDAKKAAEIQKQISTLESRFDQKRIEHVIEMKKINPDAGRGYMGGGSRCGGMGGGPRCGSWR